MPFVDYEALSDGDREIKRLDQARNNIRTRFHRRHILHDLAMKILDGEKAGTLDEATAIALIGKHEDSETFTPHWYEQHLALATDTEMLFLRVRQLAEVEELLVKHEQ